MPVWNVIKKSARKHMSMARFRDSMGEKGPLLDRSKQSW
jgi:hypothetical protein